jgi:hypothetical protein
MPTEDYLHMMMEMKLMVDGDDGGEDGLRSPPPGEKSWIDLIPESMIVALAVLCFANSLNILGHPLFDIYERVRKSWRRGGARGPNKQAPYGEGIWPHGPCPFGPWTPPRVPPMLRHLLRMKNWRSIFFPNFISCKNNQKWDSAKNNVRFYSFIQVWDDSGAKYEAKYLEK